jgi:hypothetical protein
MTKISNEIAYEIVNSPSLDDYVIGTKTPNSNKPTKNFSMKEVDKSLVYVCNAIVFEAEITFSGLSSCLNTINFNKILNLK